MITHIEKDILTVEKGIIFHQVNCMGVMGSGIALAIRNKWPHVFEKYREFWYDMTEGGRFKWKALGCWQVVDVADKLKVVNLFGQYDYGVGEGRKTEYSALYTALNDFNKYYPFPRNVYIPYKMSSDRAGGDWTIVEEILKDTVASEEEIFICKKPE